MNHSAVRQVIAGVMIYFTVISQVFGQAAILPDASQQYLDNNGHPLASGAVDYFVPGTTTRKTTWSNSGQTVNQTNPVHLDIGGRTVTYGQGSYRQVVKDVNNNVIWDQPTTAYGASQPTGATGTDTAPVGSVMAFTGFVVPTNWQLAYGQALNRTTFATLMTAITISAPSISCTNTSTTLTGFVDTSIIRIGAPIEATCLPTSTTVASITNATTIVVSQAAAATSTVTATIFPWGNGDQVTTFNVPDFRGLAPVGADCMGYVASGNNCAGNLTATYYGSNPGAAGQKGGTQSKNIAIANINAFTPTGTISAITPAGTITNGAITISHNAQSSNNGALNGSGAAVVPTTQAATINASQAASTFAGTPTTPTFTGASLGSGTAFSVVNPDKTVNYIIKVTPNSTGAGGVVSFGGMFGDIVCDSTLTCGPIASVNTVACTPASTTQLGCVQPDGVTTKIVGGQLTAIAGVASSVGIGSTAITGGTNGEILSVSSGNLGQVATSGSGSVAMTTSPVFVTPTLGAATATTLNTNTFTAGAYTLAGATGKTLTFNNTLTLAGIDATTLTFQGTDTYVGRSTTDTLTNKTVNCTNNTCTVRLGSDVTGNLPLNNLATGSLDQVIGYFGATSANAIGIANCSNALTYSTSTHTFGCNSIAGTGTVTSAQISAGTGIAVTTTSGANPCVATCNLTVGLTTARQTLPTVQSFTSGTNTAYTTPANVLWIEVWLVGGGSGGGGANNGSASTAGGNTCWNTSGTACTTPLLQAGGASAASNASSGAGGTTAGSLTCNLVNVPGGTGGQSGQSLTSPALPGVGGGGGSSTLGGGGGASSGATNSGAGGSGGSQGNGVGGIAGYGGSAGATCAAIINSPAGSYVLTVGAGGAGAAAGSGGNAGTSGAAGKVWIIEHYGS